MTPVHFAALLMTADRMGPLCYGFELAEVVPVSKEGIVA